jgi:acyl carrier protein phosphodiesterase
LRVNQRQKEERLELNTFTHDGIHRSLERIAHRLKRRVELAPATALLKQHEADFIADFQEFYPALMQHYAAHT